MVQVVGVDVGGTKIEAVRIDEHGTVHAHYHGLTEAHTSCDEIVLNLISAIKDVWADEVVGVGIGVPGVLRKNIIVFMPNITSFLGLVV